MRPHVPFYLSAFLPTILLFGKSMSLDSLVFFIHNVLVE